MGLEDRAAIVRVDGGATMSLRSPERAYVSSAAVQTSPPVAALVHRGQVPVWYQPAMSIAAAVASGCWL